MSKYVVTAGKGFFHNVFGADTIAEYWPEIIDSGVTIERKADDRYYILDEAGKPINDTAIFSAEELKYLNFDKDIPFRSCAEWPQGTMNGYNNEVSTDDHYGPDPHGMAVAVCAGLEREGFGGQGKIFPLKTWIEPLPVV